MDCIVVNDCKTTVLVKFTKNPNELYLGIPKAIAMSLYPAIYNSDAGLIFSYVIICLIHGQYNSGL